MSESESAKVPGLGDSGERASAVQVALMLGVMATLVSVISSWSVSFWTDEAATKSAAQRGLPELFDLLGRVDAVHGAYYVLVHFWIDAFGPSPFSLRLPSAIAAGLAAAGTYMLARKLADKRIALIAGVVFCVLPRVTWMGIEARSFAFSAAVAAWLSLLLIVGLRRTHAAGLRTAWGVWVGYSVLTAIGVMLNIYMALLVVAHGVTVLIVRLEWQTRRVWLICATAGLAVASPVLWFSINEKGQLGQQPLGIVYFVRSSIVNNWFLGDTPTARSSRVGTAALTGGGQVDFWQVSGVLLALVCWALIAVLIFRSSRLPVPTDQPRVPLPALVLPWMLLPVVVVGVASFVSTPIFNPRYFTFTMSAVAIAVAAGLACLSARWSQLLAGALILVAALPVYQSQRTAFAKSSTDWVAVADFVDRHKEPGEGVYFCPTEEETTSDNGFVRAKTRRASVAYPEAFQSLVDVTLAKNTDGPRLFPDESVPLVEASPELADLSAVWVVCPVGYSEAATRADSALLRAAGLHPGISWSGPTTTVTQHLRTA